MRLDNSRIFGYNKHNTQKGGAPVNLYDDLPDDKLDEAIAGLDAKISRKAQIDRMLPGLEAEKQRLTRLEEERRAALSDEQADVEALKKRSPLVLWLTLTDKLDARMDKEEAEALEAEAAWQAVHDELAAVSDTVGRLKAERRSFGLCEEHRASLQARKKALVMQRDAEKAQRIAGLERQTAELEARKKEVDEAVGAAERMALLCTEALSALSDLSAACTAHRSGRYVSFSSNMDEADKAKRNAESYIESIRILMTELRSELNDLEDMELPELRQPGPAPMDVSILMRGLFIGSNLGTISDRLEDVKSLARSVDTVLDRLCPVRARLDDRIRNLKAQTEAVIGRD